MAATHEAATVEQAIDGAADKHSLERTRKLLENQSMLTTETIADPAATGVEATVMMERSK